MFYFSMAIAVRNHRISLSFPTVKFAIVIYKKREQSTRTRRIFLTVAGPVLYFDTQIIKFFFNKIHCFLNWSQNWTSIATATIRYPGKCAQMFRSIYLTTQYYCFWHSLKRWHFMIDQPEIIWIPHIKYGHAYYIHKKRTNLASHNW